MGNASWGEALMLLAIVLTTVVLGSSLHSELQWKWKDELDGTNDIRRLVGIPSIAVGTLSPAQRNPMVEMYCTSFYDAPGSYCAYYTTGVAWHNLTWWRVDA